MDWWKTHKFSDLDLEAERLCRLIGEDNQEAGRRAVEEFRGRKLKQ